LLKPKAVEDQMASARQELFAGDFMWCSPQTREGVVTTDRKGLWPVRTTLAPNQWWILAYDKFGGSKKEMLDGKSV